MAKCKACGGTGKREISPEEGPDQLVLCDVCNVSEVQFEVMRKHYIEHMKADGRFFMSGPVAEDLGLKFLALFEHAHYGDKH